MNLRTAALAAAAAIALAASAHANFAPQFGYPDFALGADLSSILRMEQDGTQTHYLGTTVSDMEVTSIAGMARDHGLDAVRLRVWVDPEQPLVKGSFKYRLEGHTQECLGTYGYCSPQQLLAMADKFSLLGLRVMVVFQLSDTWADPARQFIPQAWADCTSADELVKRVRQHIYTVLEALYIAEINVEWVQIGNETNTGMLKYTLPATNGGDVEWKDWGCGIASNNAETTANFVKVFNAAAQTARTVYPNAKIVMHLANGHDMTKINWTLQNLKRSGFDFSTLDYLGLSLYPCNDPSDTDTYQYTAKWLTHTAATVENIAKVHSTYGLRTMLCEIGLNNEYSLSTPTAGVSAANLQAANIAQCNSDIRAMTEYLIDSLRGCSTCDGIFYWEAGSDYLDDYTKGACVSITPGASWPRTKITANPYWQVCSERSDGFATCALRHYTHITGISSRCYMFPHIIVDDIDHMMHYNADIGNFFLDLDCGPSTPLRFTLNVDGLEPWNMRPYGTLENGITTMLHTADGTFTVPYEGHWHFVFNSSRLFFNAYCDTPDPSAPTVLPLCIYSTDADRFYPMTTTDGTIYSLTGLEAKQWFNFKVATEDWSVALGNAEIGFGKEGILNNDNDWNAWTDCAVAASDTWWLRNDTHAMTITHSADCPWTLPAAPSTYSFTYLDVSDLPNEYPVFAYITDAEGHPLSGVLPGLLIPSNGVTRLTTTGTPAHIRFTNGVYTYPQYDFIDGAIYDHKGFVALPAAWIDEAADGPAEYYDIMGRRLAAPTPGTLCIERRGSAARKIVVR